MCLILLNNKNLKFTNSLDKNKCIKRSLIKKTFLKNNQKKNLNLNFKNFKLLMF